MSTGGYQSDTDLQDINFVGDFPIEHSIGGFGTTTGSNNAYTVNLTTPLTTNSCASIAKQLSKVKDTTRNFSTFLIFRLF